MSKELDRYGFEGWWWGLSEREIKALIEEVNRMRAIFVSAHVMDDNGKLRVGIDRKERVGQAREIGGQWKDGQIDADDLRFVVGGLPQQTWTTKSNGEQKQQIKEKKERVSGVEYVRRMRERYMSKMRMFGLQWVEFPHEEDIVRWEEVRALLEPLMKIPLEREVGVVAKQAVMPAFGIEEKKETKKPEKKMVKRRKIARERAGLSKRDAELGKRVGLYIKNILSGDVDLHWDCGCVEKIRAGEVVLVSGHPVEATCSASVYRNKKGK